MAETTTHLGDDPLAWLMDEAVVTQPGSAEPVADKADKAMPVKNTDADIELVEQSFAVLAEKAYVIVADFYQNLLNDYPELAYLFEGELSPQHLKKMQAALVMLVENQRRPDILQVYLTDLGERHHGYGVTETDYQKLLNSLLKTMKKHAGTLWTAEVEAAWKKRLTVVKNMMVSTRGEMKGKESTAEPQTNALAEFQTQIELQELKAQMSALDEVMAVMSFAMDGTILAVNNNFLQSVGYGRKEILGQHHRMFIEPQLANSPAYTQFWVKLNQGDHDERQCKHIGKNGQEIWLQAYYIPIFDEQGKPYKVTMFAIDITAHRQLQMTAEDVVSKTSAVRVEMADREFSRNMEAEFAQQQNSVNGTAVPIADMVLGKTTAVTETAAENVEFIQRTQEQACLREEMVADMEKLIRIVKQNSDNAIQASTLEMVVKGSELIQRTIQAMHAISGFSQKVTDVIGIIDEISFQTNLLALSAAVEAARTGEQGHGFAVLASEMRDLAQRSTAAVKEIKVLNRGSDEKVRQSSQLVDETGRLLEKIVIGVRKVSESCCRNDHGRH